MGISGPSFWLSKPPELIGWAVLPSSFLSHDPASVSTSLLFRWNVAASSLHAWSPPCASDPYLWQPWNCGSSFSTTCLPFDNSCEWRLGRLVAPCDTTGQRTELSDASKGPFCGTWAEPGSKSSDSVEATSDNVLERRDFSGWESGVNWELKEGTCLDEAIQSRQWTCKEILLEVFVDRR